MKPIAPSDSRQAIIDTLATTAPLSIKAIANALGRNYYTVAQSLKRMLAAGIVHRPSYGMYALADSTPTADDLVLDALANMDRPASPSDLATMLAMPVEPIASSLNRLARRGRLLYALPS